MLDASMTYSSGASRDADQRCSTLKAAQDHQGEIHLYQSFLKEGIGLRLIHSSQCVCNDFRKSYFDGTSAMNETSTGGPLPSRHVFLHELAKLAGGTKVRFLGCVVDYEVSTASLLLEHAFPQSILPAPQASLDIGLVLEFLKARDLQRGSWLNIIGYVRKPEQRQKKTNVTTNEVKIAVAPTVEAIVVWGAGAIKVTDYEAALLSHKEVKKDSDFYALT